MAEHERRSADHERVGRPEADRAAAGPERGPAERLASTVGNAAFARLARSGAGILPSGKVHPDVQAAIDGRRGGGVPLDGVTRERMAPVLGDPLHDVRVHTDGAAGALARSVDARAFTTGADVFFGAGEYRPADPAGARLLAHELTHVVQQRGAPASGPLQVTDPGDAEEVAAERVADGLDG